MSQLYAPPVHPRSVDANHKTRRLLIIGGLVVLTLFVIGGIVLAVKWPFTEAAVLRDLTNLGEGEVRIGNFRQTFFPAGCVAEQVTFTRPDGHTAPGITISRMTVTGSYLGMFEVPRHIRKLQLDGLVVSQLRESRLNRPSKNKKLVIDEITANGSELLLPVKGEQPLRFRIRELTLKNVQAGKPFGYRVVVRLPEPPGDASAAGTAGPINEADAGMTPLSGSFELRDADLGVFSGIGGIVNAKGKFDGELDRLETNGSTYAPKFLVKKTDHSLPLDTQFRATVDGTNGDVKFTSIDAKLGETPIHATGEISGKQGVHGKTVVLNTESAQGRIQDLMYLFVHSDSPLRGSTAFRAKVVLEPEQKPFVERVILDSDFGIDKSKFKPTTQAKVEKLSEQAQGNPEDPNPPAVITDLRGHVRLQDGVARFSKLDVSVPGASANLHGTYNVESHVVNLSGTLRTQVKLSKATTGFKAFLMKAVEFAKGKKKGGASVPVKITGTYQKPSFNIDAPKEK